MHDPPSYTAGDEFPFISEKKVNSSSTLPPSPSTSTYSSTYAPSPAPFSLTAALNVSQPGGQNTLGRQPISFTRTRSQGAGFTYTPFKPIFLFTTGDSSGQSTSLSNGFPMTPPPSKENPHPFVTHDVNEIDWLQSALSPVRILPFSSFQVFYPGFWMMSMKQDPWLKKTFKDHTSPLCQGSLSSVSSFI